MDQQEYKLVEARDQAKWVALLSVVVAIVGWILVGKTLNEVFGSVSAAGEGYLVAGSLAIAIIATVVAGTSMVVAWVSSVLAPSERK